jgi:hypothetical protein
VLADDISGGEDNKRRLTGAHETAPITQFSWGVANRGCSVRIPRMTEKEQCGYFEDRRPASNMDPYTVTGQIMETCVLPDCAKGVTGHASAPFTLPGAQAWSPPASPPGGSPRAEEAPARSGNWPFLNA